MLSDYPKLTLEKARWRAKEILGLGRRRGSATGYRLVRAYYGGSRGRRTLYMVPEAGFEPACPCGREILSL